MTIWGATAKGPTTVRAEQLGYTKEMAGFEGDRRMERTNPELTDGAHYGPSPRPPPPPRGPQPRLPPGYGHGASIGARETQVLRPPGAAWGPPPAGGGARP